MMRKPKLSHTEGRKRRERLWKAIDKRATTLMKLIGVSGDHIHRWIADALYDEVCRTESRLRSWK